MLLRAIHLVSSIALVGACAALLLGGRSDRPTACAWHARVLTTARATVLVALASGLGVLAQQLVVLEGRLSAILDAAALVRLVADTQAGIVWLARHGLLGILGVFLALEADTRARVDWLAARGEAVLLGSMALGLGALAGHAAAVEPTTARAVLVDVVHLLAAGIWLGGLVPIAMLLHAAGRPEGEDARAYAVLATRRFSRAALIAVLLLGVTGVANAATHVGSVAGLVGTRYGHLLLAKLALLVPILVIGALNRRRLVPALSGDAGTIGRPAMARLGRFVIVEAILAGAVLVVVAAMAVTPPARHVEPLWPFSFRLTLDALDDATSSRGVVLAASQMAVLGIVALISAMVLARHRAMIALAGVGLLAVGLGLGLPPLSVDAYPTTYRRPAVPYHAESIASGMALYREHCVGCHGTTGAGDGPNARGLPRPPADLGASHTATHTAGDLFWWITHGIPGGGMPGFGDRLDDAARWDVINFVRALGAVRTARTLGPTVEAGGPRMVAPDFAFAVGPAARRALRDYRGQRTVLLVLYTLPASRERLAHLADKASLLALLGVEVIAAPRDASPDAIRALGGEPRVLFAVVTDGAPEILATYGLFAGTPHAEFLIDRQGYLRAVLGAGPGGPGDVNRLLAEVQQLNEETADVPPADEHVH